MKYSFTGKIRYSEVGEDGLLTLPGLVNYFQDCSTFQSEELGEGVDYIRSLGAVWVLSSWQIRILRFPGLGESVKVSTWASGFKGFLGFRNFTLEAEEGELLAAANSIWAYVDLHTGRPVRTPENVAAAYGLEAPLAMDFGPRKIMLPEGMEKREPFPVHRHELDTNHHVNNGQFLFLASDYLPEGRKVCGVRAEYKQQAHLGDTIFPTVKDQKDRYVVALSDEKGTPYVVVEFH